MRRPVTVWPEERVIGPDGVKVVIVGPTAPDVEAGVGVGGGGGVGVGLVVVLGVVVSEGVDAGLDVTFVNFC
jgi:hypothetical protein